MWTSPIGIDSGTQLNSVSCPTSSFCVAVDNNGQGFTYTGSATNWARTTIDPNQDQLNSVSCPSTTFCVAVGSSGNEYTYNGSSWAAAAPVMVPAARSYLESRNANTSQRR